jgi:phospholipase C
MPHLRKTKTIGAAVLAAGLSVVGMTTTRLSAGSEPTAPIKHLVVIYMENHSFDNLYGLWGPVNGQAVHGQTNGHDTQIGQDGATLGCLDQNDVNLQNSTNPAVLPPSCTDTHHTVPATGPFTSSFTNDQFKIDTYIPPDATTCSKTNGFSDVPIGTGAPGGCTRDLVHRFYQEQYQIDGGKQDRYVAGSDAEGLVMGYTDTTQLPIWQYVHGTGPYAGAAQPNYILHDNFFQGGFGGSFANHQMLVSAQLPFYAGADKSGTTTGCATGSAGCDLHSVVDSNGNPSSSPYYIPTGSVKDQAVSEAADAAGNCSASYPTGAAGAPAGTLCGDYAINTIQPLTQPYSPGTALGRRLPLLSNDNIGNEMDKAAVSWGWFAGGWGNAAGQNGADPSHPLSRGWTGGAGPSCANSNVKGGATFPYCPDALFQFHHQPLGYYANYADGTSGRAQHLKDEQDLIGETDANGQELPTFSMASSLPQVSFIKPIGEQNEHPGYASVLNGQVHLVKMIQALLGPSNPDAASTAVFVTYDEFGGFYDHVPPPGTPGGTGPFDAFGPGTRIPAITLANNSLLRQSFVDHRSHDTVAILSVIEALFGVQPIQAEAGSKVTTLRDVREFGMGY